MIKFIKVILFLILVLILSDTQAQIRDLTGSSAAICRNSTFTISMRATQPIRYKFMYSIDGGTSWTNLSNLLSDASANTWYYATPTLQVNTIFKLVYTTDLSDGSIPNTEYANRVSVIVNPLPTVNPVTYSTNIVCQNSNLTFSNTTSNGVWASDDVNVATVNSTGIIHGVNAGQAYISYTVTDAVTGCTNMEGALVTVNPTPIISSYSDAVCSGIQYAKIPSGLNTSGATFNWGMPTTTSNPGDLTGMAPGTSQANVNALLVNNTISVITASYSITATKGACTSTPFILTLSVTPKPYIANRVDDACSGVLFNVAPTNSAGNIVPVGITYSWSMPTLPTGLAGGAASGAGSPTSISGQLNNSTNGTLSATYLVSTYNAGCAGSTFTQTINVNPTPKIVAAQYATICSNSTFSVLLTNGINLVPVGTTYSWNAPVVYGINGLQAGVNASVISGTLSNTTSATVSNIAYSVIPTAGACSGSSFYVYVTVNPVPIIADIGPTQTGSGSAFDFAITGSIVPANTTYSWAIPSMPNGLTGGVASGIPSPTSLTGTLTNPTGAALDALYTITPTYLNCSGNSFVYTVRVYPKPIIGSKILTAICSGQSFPPVVITDGVDGDVVPGGTTYSWSAPVVAGITGTATGTAAGTISGTLINITNYPIVVTYSVIPYANPQAGAPFNISITVNPLPISSIFIAENSGRQSNDNIICSNSSATITAVPIVGLLTDYNYTWTVPSGINAPSNVSSFTSSTAGTYSLSVTNNTTGCVSAVQTATSLAVNIIPSVGTISSTTNTVCVGASIQLNTVGDNGGATPYTYNWTYPTITTGASSTNTSTVSLNGVNAGNGDITYTILDNVGCYSNNSAAFNVTVYAKPLLPTISPINVVYDGLSHQVIATPATAPVGSDVIEWYAASTGGVAINPAPSHTNVVSTSYWAQAINNTTGCVNNDRVKETFVISQKGLVITANDYQKIYDRVVYSGGNGIAFSDPITGIGPGFVNGETVAVLGGSLIYSGTSQNKIDVGTYSIIPGGLTSTNYNIRFVAGVLNITKKIITISGATVADKIYDGTDVANMSGGTLSGVILADVPNISLNRSAKFASNKVGANLIITSISTLSGTAAPNYSLDQTINLTASITPKHINAIGVITADKIYDGTTSASVTGGGFMTAIAAGTGSSTDKKPYINDDIKLVAAGYFVSKNVANNIAITSTSTITGTDKDNYILDQPTLNSRNITPKSLEMTGLNVAAPKIYDSTINAKVTGTPALLDSEAPGDGTNIDGKPYTNDDVTITGTPVGTFNSKNVLTANRVSFSGLSLTGVNAGNYSLTIQTAATSSILPKSLTMFGLNVPASKVYDGTTSAVVSGTAQLQAAENSNEGNSADGKPYNGDDVSITGTPVATYNSFDVATASYVTFSGLSLAGKDSSNYLLIIQENAPAIIIKKNIKVEADAQTKIYGNKDPLLSFIYEPLVKGDTLTGILTRDPGESAGIYQIKLGTLNFGPNYTISFVPNNLTITRASIIVIPDVIKRTYGDIPLPASFATTNFKAIGLQNGEVIKTITLYPPFGPGSGNDLKDGVGNYIGVVKSGLPNTGTIDLANYLIEFYDADIMVEKLPITITADPKEKRMSQLDPLFTYQLSRPLVEGDVLTGGLTRMPGEIVGFYPILQGDLVINDNYDISYLSADLEILTIERVLVIPNAFTPNNDGLNDVLKVMHNSTIVSINYFKVFNRAGNLIYETKNMNEGWDGKINGSIADADAYYWIVEYNTWDHKVFKVKGSTLLIK